jgi:hypothetical protein
MNSIYAMDKMLLFSTLEYIQVRYYTFCVANKLDTVSFIDVDFWIWGDMPAGCITCCPPCIALLDHLCLNQQRKAYIRAPLIWNK